MLLHMSNNSRKSGSTPRHSVSVAGAVTDSEGRFLVIRRADSGAWELPGGVLELAETPEVGVWREVWEETGVEVEVGGLSGVYKNLARGIVALVFRCRPVGGALRVSEESSEVVWLTADEVGERVAEVFAVRLFDAVRDGVVVRSHDGWVFVDGS
ncbi:MULTISPECIES: NUDIX hydrolase [Streptomyces]|uniref:NUDIX domain-containing protein n=1 Tax=Streptomyces evansiae TaxID=3075535 RepID=A0ABU2R5I8_9ACTN|nr:MULTISPECIES: NUDIX domain-containing protein [unclassified Streptomyces]MDT0411954.1 NUDIX domain-containing protein [Streptomyces sp. DSM 41979]MYQ58938.1 NUDIX domain-containing protein [Streptomyces sp. SID4926]